MHYVLKLKDERNGRPKSTVVDEDPMEYDEIRSV